MVSLDFSHLLLTLNAVNAKCKQKYIFQVHRGIKGIVKDEDGHGIKGAIVSLRGNRHYVTTGTNEVMVKYI